MAGTTVALAGSLAAQPLTNATGSHRLLAAQYSGSEIMKMDFDTPDFHLTLASESQTVVALKPKDEDGFDFAPSDRATARSGDGFYNLGDLTLRLRTTGANSWTDYATATRRKPVTPVAAKGDVIAAADLTPA